MNTDLNYGLVSSCECAHNCERKLLFNDLEQQFKTYFDNNRHFFVNFEYSDLKNNFSEHMMDIIDTNDVNPAIDGIIKSESIEQPLEELIEDNVMNDDIICPNLDINDSFHEDCNLNNETQAVTQVINIKKEVNDCNQNECQSLTVKKKRPYVRRKPLKKSAKTRENFHSMSKIIKKFKATENNSTEDNDCNVNDNQIKKRRYVKRKIKPLKKSTKTGENFQYMSTIIENNKSKENHSIDEEMRTAANCEDSARQFDEPPYECPHCQRLLKTKLNLKRHLVSLHSPVKPYNCHECGRGFCQNAYLVQHRIDVHEREKRFECAECQFRTTSDKYLGNHRRRVHEKHLRCNFPGCGYKTLREGELARHNSVEHFGERPFVCPHCRRVMKTKLILQRHIVSRHSSSKPYNCDECGRGFVLRAYLAQHKLSVHCREKMFKCDECKFRTSLSKYLIVHKRRKHQLKSEAELEAIS